MEDRVCVCRLLSGSMVAIDEHLDNDSISLKTDTRKKKKKDHPHWRAMDNLSSFRQFLGLCTVISFTV